MTRLMRIQFIVVLLSTVLAGFVLCRYRLVPGIDLAGGAELRYKVLFEPGFKGDRQGVTKEASDVVRRRLESRLLQEPKINAVGDDEIIVQLPGVDADGLRDCKRLIGPMGELRLHAAAIQELQERYDGDKVVPAGHKVVGKLLLEASPVIEGRHIVNAAPERAPRGWVTAFELDAEGAKRFDEAAERLHRRSPRGRIAIVLDGAVKSAPVVESPAFHGRGQIKGAGD
jgi:preprotein translocase subunit SecD